MLLVRICPRLAGLCSTLGVTRANDGGGSPTQTHLPAIAPELSGMWPESSFAGVRRASS